jgi:hypothetical protein
MQGKNSLGEYYKVQVTTGDYSMMSTLSVSSGGSQ